MRPRVPRDSEKIGQQTLPPCSLAMADLNFQVKHAHLLQLHPRFVAGTENTIKPLSSTQCVGSVVANFAGPLCYELFGRPQPCETHYLSFLPGLRWFEAQKRLRSVKTLSSTCGVGTIVAGFARQFLLLTFRVPHPCEIHCLSLFPGM